MKIKFLVYNIKDIEAIHRGCNSTFWITIKENDFLKRKRIAKSYFMELKKTILVTELIPMQKLKNKDKKSYKTYNIENIESIQKGYNYFWVTIKKNKNDFPNRKRIAKEYYFELKRKNIPVKPLYEYHQRYNLEDIFKIYTYRNMFWVALRKIDSPDKLQKKRISEEYFYELTEDSPEFRREFKAIYRDDILWRWERKVKQIV